MELDKNLKQLRKENNITQEYLAQKLYVSIQTINKWENGKCLPDVSNLLHISEFYGVSLDFLMKNKLVQNFSKKDTENDSFLKSLFNNLLLNK